MSVSRAIIVLTGNTNTYVFNRSGVLLLKFLCDLLFHWKLDGCKLPLRGWRLRAQVCGVANIFQG
jgi:hypothetical protein